MKKVKIIKNTVKSFLLFFVSFIVFSLSSFLAFGSEEGCVYACSSVADCLEENPEIITSCEFPATCESFCQYIVPENISRLSQFNKHSMQLGDTLLSVEESSNMFKNAQNRTVISGMLNISSGMLSKYFFFVLKDPKRILMGDLERVHFNQNPFKVTNDSIVFLLEKNSSVHLITYYIEPEVVEKLAVENQTILSENTEFREPSLLEKVEINLLGQLTPKMVKIVKVLIIFIFIAITAVFVFLFIRRNESIKELKDKI